MQGMPQAVRVRIGMRDMEDTGEPRSMADDAPVDFHELTVKAPLSPNMIEEPLL